MKNESIGGFWLSSFDLDWVEVMHLKVLFYLQHVHNYLIQSVHVVLIKLSIFASLLSIILKWFVCLRKRILTSPVRFMVEIRRLDNERIRRNVLVGNWLWLVLIIIITEASHEWSRPVGFNAIDESTALDQGAGVVFADFDVRLWLFVLLTDARAWLLLMLMGITAIWLSHHVTRLWSEHFIVVFTLGCWLFDWHLLLALFIVIFLAILILFVIFSILKLHLHFFLMYLSSLALFACLLVVLIKRTLWSLKLKRLIFKRFWLLIKVTVVDWMFLAVELSLFIRTARDLVLHVKPAVVLFGWARLTRFYLSTRYRL